MDRKDGIRDAYRLTGSNDFYDGMITCSTGAGRAVCRLVWDMDKAECDAYLERALSGIPEGFAGRLPEAEVTCLDYSPDMMAQAREKAERLGLANVRFRQGDVGALPFPDGSFDAVLSLNGFHAFPDKEAAYRETYRVLKSGGVFCGCFYIKGGHRRTDWFVRRVYQRTKFFTPPYETETSLRRRLNGMYAQAEAGTLKGIAWFVCRKEEAE